mmetsp:Transcript_21363/g.35332  ORF Transcript_21363/g.35332 Transcript_21363/m.35332 type:complete len:91 (-) Transcript_21363:525-797(-)
MQEQQEMKLEKQREQELQRIKEQQLQEQNQSHLQQKKHQQAQGELLSAASRVKSAKATTIPASVPTTQADRELRLESIKRRQQPNERYKI